MSYGRWAMPWECGCKEVRPHTLDRCGTCGYDRPQAIAPEPDDVCWLIESVRGNPALWALPHTTIMQPDAHKAWRFASKAHAEAALASAYYGAAHAVEHVFIRGGPTHG